jgi:hypothetical protein
VVWYLPVLKLYPGSLLFSLGSLSSLMNSSTTNLRSS